MTMRRMRRVMPATLGPGGVVSCLLLVLCCRSSGPAICLPASSLNSVLEADRWAGHRADACAFPPLVGVLRLRGSGTGEQGDEESGGQELPQGGDRREKRRRMGLRGAAYPPAAAPEALLPGGWSMLHDDDGCVCELL